jgi:hypothetical protein
MRRTPPSVANLFHRDALGRITTAQLREQRKRLPGMEGGSYEPPGPGFESQPAALPGRLVDALDRQPVAHPRGEASLYLRGSVPQCDLRAYGPLA